MADPTDSGNSGESVLLERATGGDADAFQQLVTPLRAELRVHCYRMLGALEDADGDALDDGQTKSRRRSPEQCRLI